MIRIGLTGSIAMGKSEVVNILRHHGIPVFDADQAVHELYDSPEGASLIKPIAPEAIINGKVDRALLTRNVMQHPEKLTQLEKRVHGQIVIQRDKFFTKAESDGHAIAAADVPLLFETGGDKQVDVTVVVSAPRDLQHQRALARPGMTEEKLKLILSRQMPDAEKRQRADHVIENSGTLTDLKTRSEAVLATIRKEHSL